MNSNALAIISGGQTGADRAALDFAIEHGLPHGGWCPRGRCAEDGPIPPQYDLQETPSSRYSQRTEWNVRDSDGTVVFSIRPDAIGGTALTLAVARRLGKPCLHLCRDAASPAAPQSGETNEGESTAVAAAAEKLAAFLDEHEVARLNVAGPRASQEPQIAMIVREVLECVFEAGRK